VTKSPDPVFVGTPRRPWWAGPWPLAAFFFAWCLFFYTRHNARPHFYEKDAPSKVAQVISGERNFFHPLLMVNSADAVLRLCGLERTEENASLAGHWAIAIFGAVSVATFVLLAFRCGGWLAALAVGVWLSLNEFLLQLAHYFKEDPAMLMGLALSFLAMKLFHERPTLTRAAWLGAACGVAIAGKYVGVAALILALPLVLVPRGARLTRVAVLLAGCLGVLLAINWQWVADFQALRTGVHTQMDDLLREDMMKKIPHTKDVLGYYRSNLPVLIVLGVFLQIAHLVCCDGRRRPVEWALLVYAALFTIVLAWTPRLFERHFLPVFVALWLSSALGWVNSARWLWQRFPRLPASITAATLAVVACGAWQFQDNFFDRLHRYTTDHRASLARWIRKNLPEDAVIAQDRRVFLARPDGSPRPDFALPQRIVTVDMLSDLREVKVLRKRGVTHVAMHRLDSGRFMPGGKLDKSAPTTTTGRNRPERQAFYSELKSHTHHLWGGKDDDKDDDEEGNDSGLLLYALDFEE
jgi:hypothetical protein